MNMQSVREIAKQRSITPRKRGKIDLIRTLQLEEGNFDCFAKAYASYCDQSNCLWGGRQSFHLCANRWQELSSMGIEVFVFTRKEGQDGT